MGLKYLYGQATIDTYYGKPLKYLIKKAFKEWATHNKENIMVMLEGQEVKDKFFKGRDWFRAIIIDTKYFMGTKRKEHHIFVNNIFRKKKEVQSG